MSVWKRLSEDYGRGNWHLSGIQTESHPIFGMCTISDNLDDNDKDVLCFVPSLESALQNAWAEIMLRFDDQQFPELTSECSFSLFDGEYTEEAEKFGYIHDVARIPMLNENQVLYMTAEVCELTKEVLDFIDKSHNPVLRINIKRKTPGQPNPMYHTFFDLDGLTQLHSRLPAFEVGVNAMKLLID